MNPECRSCRVDDYVSRFVAFEHNRGIRIDHFLLSSKLAALSRPVHMSFSTMFERASLKRMMN